MIDVIIFLIFILVKETDIHLEHNFIAQIRNDDCFSIHFYALIGKIKSMSRGFFISKKVIKIIRIINMLFFIVAIWFKNGI